MRALAGGFGGIGRLLGIVVLAAATRTASLAAEEDSPLFFNRIERTPDGVTLEWTDPINDREYTIQQRSQLGAGIWLNVDQVHPWPTPNRQWTDRELDESSFYRIVAVPRAERGDVMSTALIESLSLEQIRLLFFLAEVPAVAEHGVDVYRVVYETLGILGEPTTASGVLVLPQDVDGALPLVTYQHGTLVLDSEAPSSSLAGESLLGVAFASTGYAAVLPDYLGLGEESPGFHPYHHAQSEATAGVDLLRAVKRWCDSQQIALSGQLFLCGYSQGGHATMALHRELETRHADEFTVTASAPMAGAYDLSGVTFEDILSDRPMPNPYYTAYLLAAYQDVYRFDPGWETWLASPYAETLPPLLDGEHDEELINAAMPRRLNEMLKPAHLEALEADPQHPLRIALRANDVLDWTPQAPMRLYHCPADEDVIFQNAEVALARFHSRGATQVELIVPDPDGDHGDCTEPSLLLAKAWFDSFVTGPALDPITSAAHSEDQAARARSTRDPARIR